MNVSWFLCYAWFCVAPDKLSSFQITSLLVKNTFTIELSYTNYKNEPFCVVECSDDREQCSVKSYKQIRAFWRLHFSIRVSNGRQCFSPQKTHRHTLSKRYQTHRRRNQRFNCELWLCSRRRRWWSELKIIVERYCRCCFAFSIIGKCYNPGERVAFAQWPSKTITTSQSRRRH